jgi:hypothetical protein
LAAPTSTPEYQELRDYLAEDDAHALQLARTIVSTLNSRKTVPGDVVPPEDPAYAPDEIYGIVPADIRKPYDVREVVARLVDGSRFDEFKERYAPTIVSGFARLHGFLVGIVANNGVLFSESALKATHFIELCNQRGIRSSSCRTSPASWSGGSTSVAASPRMAPKWCTRSRTRWCRSSRLSSGGRSVPAITGCAVGRSSPDSSGCGRTRVSPSWEASRPPACSRPVKREQLARDNKTLGAEGEQEIRQPILDKYEREGSPYYSHRAVVGRRHSRSRADAHRAGAGAVGCAQCPDSGAKVRSLPDVKRARPSRISPALWFQTRERYESECPIRFHRCDRRGTRRRKPASASRWPRGLAAHGASVCIASRSDERARNAAATLAGRFGTPCGGCAADVASEEGVNRLRDHVTDLFGGRVNIAIDSAGINVRNPIDQISLGEFEAVQRVNITGAFLFARAMHPLLRAAGWGRLINVASIFALTLVCGSHELCDQ